MTLLFIGGFMDKRTGIVKAYQQQFQQNFPTLHSEYYQWHEKRKVRERIRHLEGKVIVIGHSYGAATAANILHQHKVDLLITIDPVSRIWSRKKPQTKHWININARPSQYDLSDFIALIGGKWGKSIRHTVHEYHEVETNHAKFAAMVEKVLASHLP